MAQNLNVATPQVRYTRIDFAALRARLQRLPIQTIIQLYYNEDDLYDRKCSSPDDVEEWLLDMRDHLAKRALSTNPHLAQTLSDARARDSWSKPVVEFLVQSAEKDLTTPRLQDSLSAWFRPRVSSALASVQLKSLADLKSYIESRGKGWYRPIIRLGPGKARAIENWLGSNSNTLGAVAYPKESSTGDIVAFGDTPRLVPLSRINTLVSSLDGQFGRNRSASFCLISARNDLEAVHAYLYKFRGQPKTWRSYEKELNRFLLWCVCERKIALSSVLTEECEAYKDFLAHIPSHWIGIRVSRASSLWRPFVTQISVESQRYAILVLRGFFDWLFQVRYLGGNPWVTVSAPLVPLKEVAMQIDKALPKALWDRLIQPEGLLDKVCSALPYSAGKGRALTGKNSFTMGAQARLARAAIFLIGMTGIRREEAATATRKYLKPVQGSKGNLWELSVLGKRKKWRTVFMPTRVVEALQLHWLDRGVELTSQEDFPLLSPVVIPQTATAKQKHIDSESGLLVQSGFAPDGLYTVVKTALAGFAADESVPLSDEEREILRLAAPHALRHTYATQAVAKDIPLDVLQRILGHASQQTTSIYVQAERARSIEEVQKMWEK